MKKTLLTLLTVLSISTAFAQIPTNATVYDCNGASKNIYATLATGKSIIIANKGVDCSICVNSAPGWQTWAAANTGDVEVWGAITYTYSPSRFTVANMCFETARWKSTHAWNDIFTYPDSNRLWAQPSSPRYYVYSAIDSSIVYNGTSSVIARNTALAQSTVGISSSILNNAKVFAANDLLNIKNLPQNVNQLSIYNTNGQLVLEHRLTEGNQEINISNYKKGIYIVRFANEKGTESRKLVF